jgi:hypothetical protein
MASFKLNRRAFLTGVGGVAVGLPLLEIMLDRSPSSQAAEIPKRFLVCFDGQSLGADDDPLHNDYVPDILGPGYDLKSALAPIADFGVQDSISVVSGLMIPWASMNGGTVPAGGRPDDFHIQSLGPLFSGVRSMNHDVRGPTSDQIVANAIGGATTFKNLTFRVQAGWYLSVSAPYGRDIMSYKDNGSGGVDPVPATVSPKQAFDTLFYNFTPDTTPEEAAAQDLAWRKRKSVLDLVRGNAERLTKRLGGADKRRIERHLDELRDLEIRVNALPPVAQGACQPPGDPGMDPSLGGAQGVDAEGNNTYSSNLGYSGEEDRAKLFCDLVHMALTCDLARVGTLQFTMAQSHLNMYPITGQATDLHEIGHNGVKGGTMAVSQAIAWHTKHFAYLVKKLRDTPEGSGNLLDNCALVFLNEGGHGLDPSSGKQNSAHSTENMACLIAGGAGGLKGGVHVSAPGMHPANVLITAMNAVGVQTDTLGEVKGTIPGLLG